MSSKGNGRPDETIKEVSLGKKRAQKVEGEAEENSTPEDTKAINKDRK